MPPDRTQRILASLGTLGVATSCFGCALLSQNQVGPAQISLVIAWLILVPLFIYLISIRRRTKRVVRQRQDVKQQELDALASLQGMVSSNSGEPTRKRPARSAVRRSKPAQPTPADDGP